MYKLKRSIELLITIADALLLIMTYRRVVGALMPHSSTEWSKCGTLTASRVEGVCKTPVNENKKLYFFSSGYVATSNKVSHIDSGK